MLDLQINRGGKINKLWILRVISAVSHRISASKS